MHWGSVEALERQKLRGFGEELGRVDRSQAGGEQGRTVIGAWREGASRASLRSATQQWSDAGQMTSPL